MNRLHYVVWMCLYCLFCGSGCAPVGEPPNSVMPDITPINTRPKSKPELQPDMPLKDRIETALNHVKQRKLITSNSFWTVIHGILGNGIDVEIHDDLTGTKVKAIDYIRNGGYIRGMKFIRKDEGIDVRIGPVFDGQGHQDQFVAELAQCGMKLDAVFVIEDKDEDEDPPKFEDFLRYTKAHASVTGAQELSWTLVALSQYYGTEISWTNSLGEVLHFEDLVRYELEQPIVTAACGGTHRLFGLTWAYHVHMRDGGKMTRVWADVAAKLKKYQDLAKTLQNPDGSFSTEYFAERAFTPDVDRRIGTTGHIVEWLALSLPNERLREPWVQEAVNALVLMIMDHHEQLLDAGSLYHAAHGLHLYYGRVFADAKSHAATNMIPLPPVAPPEISQTTNHEAR